MKIFYSFCRCIAIAVLAAAVFSCGGGSSSKNDSGGNSFQAGELTVKVAKDGSVTAEDASKFYTGKFISSEDAQGNRTTSDTYVQFEKKGADGYIVRILVNLKTQQTIFDWQDDFYEFYYYPNANIELPGGKIAADVICAGRLDKRYTVIGGSEIWEAFDASTKESICEIKRIGWIQPYDGQIALYNVQGMKPNNLFLPATGKYMGPQTYKQQKK